MEYLYKDNVEYQKHVEKLIERVDMTGQEEWMLGADVEMFKGWDRANSANYEIGNTFKRNGVKYLVIDKPKKAYEEPNDPDVFRPIQYHAKYKRVMLEDGTSKIETTYLVCNHIEGEYLLKGAKRICPIDGKVYWMKSDVLKKSMKAPSEGKKLNPKEWGEV